MALGFRKSLFGYNCEDVSEFLHKSENSHKQAIASLNASIEEIKDKLASANADIEMLVKDKNELQNQLDFYKSKYEEVKTLSENIGKLYLVAQTNAKSIIDTADKARAASIEEIQENISLLNNTNASLSEIKQSVIAMSENFINEIEKLTESLDEIKKIATAAEENGNAKVENFEKVFNNLTKWKNYI